MGSPMGSHGIRDIAFFGRGIRDLQKNCHGIRDFKILRDRDDQQNVCGIRKMMDTVKLLNAFHKSLIYVVQ